MEFLITDAAKLSAPLGRDSDSDAGQRRYRRLLQHLVVEGVIYPIGDAHRGRGSHRRFDLMETQLAAIAFHMCDLLRVPVGTVEHAIINLRGQVEQTPAIFEVPMEGFKSSIELNLWPDISIDGSRGIFSVETQEHNFGSGDFALTVVLRLDLVFARLAAFMGEKSGHD